ncbi:cell envelope biogenesis protein OmpA [Ciceribacter sp. L1K22]|uniref:cell envelope biogenesis protein OmpA n=1 Tax=Ciceribacter sp. L1K22 TaxID=2820275 RepID=UPI001ABE3707|nr:cell envelope biogenesis protein OmpA [Ciceribacter sp. L1K22]MBO3761032.1 cell envelope biogenesis protein OmpA [Ciceribacter sp. L1K22]
MFETAFTVGLTQFARTLSFPERLQHRTARNGVLEAWRLRNTGLDGFFYDVKTLTPEEIYYVSDAISAEGLILIVPPSGGPMLTVCENIDEYLARGGRNVKVLAVAGLGGSALGAAAFARNVADAVGEPVAAIVSGYGLGDIVSETIGATFLFGWLGSIRGDCEVIDDVVGRPRFGAYDDRRAGDTPVRTCLDVDTVKGLLADDRLSFRLLAGHSRGNLVLSEALYALKDEKPERLKTIAAGARIVTFGARITMPPAFQSVIDVIGDLDWYGEINSRPKIESDIRVPMAGHSTNTDMLGALRVTTLLKSILADTSESGEAHAADPLALPAPSPSDHVVEITAEDALPEPLPPEAIEAIASAEPVAEITTSVSETPPAEALEATPAEKPDSVPAEPIIADAGTAKARPATSRRKNPPSRRKG